MILGRRDIDKLMVRSREYFVKTRTLGNVKVLERRNILIYSSANYD